MSSEYVTGTITGIIATVVGFILSTLYERKRNERTERSNRIKILNLLVSELKDNLTIAEENAKLFALSMDSLRQKRIVIVAPTLFYDSGWRIGQANGIASFIDYEAYRFLTETYITLTHVNAQFNARESFRISNMALNTFYDILIAYDQRLQEKSESSVNVIKQATIRLEEAQKKLSHSS